VDTFVVADLAKEIGQAVERAVLRREPGAERDAFPLGMLGDQRRVFVLGVVLEIGVETIGPGGANDVEQPGDLIVEEGDNLWQPRRSQSAESVASRGNELVEDE